MVLRCTRFARDISANNNNNNNNNSNNNNKNSNDNDNNSFNKKIARIARKRF